LTFALKGTFEGHFPLPGSIRGAARTLASRPNLLPYFRRILHIVCIGGLLGDGCKKFPTYSVNGTEAPFDKIVNPLKMVGHGLAGA
jgi:hypothetical protein